MRIGIPLETKSGESRVAATPETVKKLITAGHSLIIQSHAGVKASIIDEAFTAAGATIGSATEVFNCDIVLKVRAPSDDELNQMRPGTVLIGMLDPFDSATINAMAGKQITAFALEAAPRTTRAQSMDVLSSQANIAGYKAVMLAANTSDVRPAAKEQIESLGAKFVDVPFETEEEKEIAKGVGGYARPMPASWMQRQAILVAERAKQADIVITTALIPGRKAPMLLAAETVQAMKPGSVIVDLAAGKGENGSGNCPLTEADQIVIKHGVTLIGLSNLPAEVAADASALYARNVLDFLKLIVTKEATLAIPSDDDIVTACLMCQNGQVIRINN